MRHNLISLLFIVLVAACNKDNEIIIDNPEDDNPPLIKVDAIPLSVLEYLPAPGQYINEAVSGFDNISTMQEACTQAQNRLLENQYVSLGAWGGQIIVGLETPVLNSGSYDFGIAGNTFDSSNEPGIVWVMTDSNKDGVPNEEWYELKGSYFMQEGYQRDFWVTYSRPESGQNTPWIDSDGESGFVNWMGSYHNQDYYYPAWVEEDSYTLHGSKLPCRAYQDPVTNLWGNKAYEWGYVDNSGSDLKEVSYNGTDILINNFKISDAIDADGKPVKIEKIDFIKVQTAIMGSAGILGENSTEVCGFFRYL